MWGRSFRAVSAIVATAALVGCASIPEDQRDPRDPLEPYNRSVYKFNTVVDDVLFKPIAKGYKAITPEPVDRGVTNFFNNLADVNSAVNNLTGGIRDQSHDRQCGDALAAPGLPDQAQCFTAFYLQVHTVDGLYDPPVGDKGGS